MSDRREDEMEEERRRLELTKLRLDIKYGPRSFFAQLANTLVIVVLAVLVLYVFQRPQLEQIRRGQEITERQQVMSLLIAAQSISEERDRSQIVQALSASWPENELLASFARSNQVLANNYLFFRAELPRAVLCSDLRTTAVRLDREISELRAAEHREVVGRSSARVGFGPVARLLAEQRDRLVSRRSQLSNRASENHCPISPGS